MLVLWTGSGQIESNLCNGSGNLVIVAVDRKEVKSGRANFTGLILKGEPR